MKYRTLFFGGTLITIATLVYTAVYYSRLPDRIATHWNINGQPDQFSDKFWGLALVPIMQLVMLLMFGLLPFLSPQRARIDSFANVYNMVCIYVLGFMGFVQVMIIQATSGTIDVTKWIVYGMIVMFGLVGNVLAKTKRNYWMGVRTPWTLESEEVWTRTHRFAGRAMVASSVIGLLLAVFGAPMMLVICIVIGACLLPVPYSFIIYKQLKLG